VHLNITAHWLLAALTVVLELTTTGRHVEGTRQKAGTGADGHSGG
jgi:hypothetical protein